MGEIKFMKKFLLTISLIFSTGVCFAYGSYGSYGGGYNSASSASSRYSATHSSYSSYGGSRNASYSSNYGRSNTASSSPSRTSSYGRSYSSGMINYSSTPKTTTYNNTANKTHGVSSTSTMTVTPFRYNTLNYTRVRNMEADPPKQFSAKCSDMGDASFCQ